MSVIVNNLGIQSTSGVLNLFDETKVIKLHTGQIIETDSYISCGTYVFMKGKDIPLVYFTQRRSTSGTNGSFVYDTTTDTVSNATGVTYTKSTPSYIAELCKVLSYISSPTYKVSQSVSNIAYSSSVATTEATRFNTNHDFVKTNYSLANKAPTIRGNLETIPNSSNAYNAITVNAKKLTLTCKTNNNSFISISVSL